MDELKDYGIKELHGLTFEELKGDYPWVLRADIENAIIGELDSELIWKDGIWYDGEWENGFWENGTWLNGKIYDGASYIKSEINPNNFFE